MTITAFASCKREKDELFNDRYELKLPYGFPEPAIPADNKLTNSRVMLGEKLFFDRSLSADNSISCGSCHLPEIAFADDTQFSTGVQGRTGLRNSPSLFNLAWATSFMRDGGVPTLELQVLAPIEDHNEMDFDILLIAERLKENKHYQDMSMRAYGRDLDAYVIMRAIAAYERTLISGNSKYDLSLQNKASLTTEETRGKDLFSSDSLACSSCHSGFLFSNNSFENNGLYSNYADSGRARITMHASDAGKFRVPSLRNVDLTAPYMHDGSLASLEEVIDHYMAGGSSHPNKSPSVHGFSLSGQDKNSLILFLKTLTEQP